MPYIGKEPARVPVTAADIPDDSITAAKIVDGAITIADIGDDQVTAAKLANSINTEIAANTAKVTNATHTGDVTGATALTIADDAVTAAKLANSINTEIAANTAKTTNATHTGEVTGSGALTITADAVTGAKIADDAVNSEHIAAGAVDDAHLATGITASKLTGALPAISGASLTGITGSSDYRPSGKPIIINGDMAIAQRSTSVASLGNSDSGYHTVDRWNYSEPTAGHITSVSVWTQTQETLTSGAAWEDGFTKAVKMDCTTADASLSGADDAAFLEYKIEGADVKAFKKGTPNAQTYTLAFWVKATKTGTHIVNLFDRTNDRYIAAAYTVSSTNTWEKKVINFAADTTGSIAAGSYYQGETGEGMKLVFGIYAGTNYTSAGYIQSSWGSAITSRRMFGQVNTADNTSNNWHMTGVQLELGTYTAATLPPFQHESYGDNLARCQRYYQVQKEVYWGHAHSGTGNRIYHPHPVEMRAAPTAVTTTTASSSLASGYTENTYTMGWNSYVRGTGNNVHARYYADITLTAEL